MKKISSIKQIANNKYSLIIDEKKHIIYGDVLLKLGIFKPMEIPSDIYIKLVNLNSYHDAYQKIVNYISFKKRTEKEVRNKLNSLHVSKKNSDLVIKELYEKGLLNNEEYLHSYVNDQINLTLNGPFKIKYNLNKLGFDDEQITNYLDSFEDNIWFDRVDKIINKKLKTIHNISKTRLIQKIKIDLNNLGYNDLYYKDKLNKIDYQDDDNLQKEYLKYKNKLSKKYSGDKLEIMVKQKLYSLGYDVSNM